MQRKNVSFPQQNYFYSNTPCNTLTLRWQWSIRFEKVSLHSWLWGGHEQPFVLRRLKGQFQTEARPQLSCKWALVPLTNQNHSGRSLDKKRSLDPWYIRISYLNAGMHTHTHINKTGKQDNYVNTTTDKSFTEVCVCVCPLKK